MIQTITLTGVTSGTVFEMPCSFKYTRYVPRKQISTKQVAKGAFFQTDAIPFKYAGNKFRFAIDAASGDDVELLNTLYKATELFLFTGVQGEQYHVSIETYNPRVICGSVYEVRGEFLIRCLITEPDFSCPT